MSKDLKIVDLEKYLSIINIAFDNVLGEEIEKLRQNAILNQMKKALIIVGVCGKYSKFKKGLFLQYTILRTRNMRMHGLHLIVLISH